MPTFHEYLKNCRIKKGLSIDEVSEAIDISRSLIYEYEANKSFPNGKNLIKLARFYQFSLDDFFEIFPRVSFGVPIYNLMGNLIDSKELTNKDNTAYYVLNDHQAVLVQYTNHYYVGKEILAFYQNKATIFKILKQSQQLFLLSKQGELFSFQSEDIKIIGMILQWISF